MNGKGSRWAVESSRFRSRHALPAPSPTAHIPLASSALFVLFLSIIDLYQLSNSHSSVKLDFPPIRSRYPQPATSMPDSKPPSVQGSPSAPLSRTASPHAGSQHDGRPALPQMHSKTNQEMAEAMRRTDRALLERANLAAQSSPTSRLPSRSAIPKSQTPSGKPHSAAASPHVSGPASRAASATHSRATSPDQRPRPTSPPTLPPKPLSAAPSPHVSRPASRAASATHSRDVSPPPPPPSSSGGSSPVRAEAPPRTSLAVAAQMVGL